MEYWIAPGRPWLAFDKPSSLHAEGQSVQNRVRSANNWFRINEASVPVAQLDRASALYQGNANQLSAAAGVAYAEARGAINP